MLKFSSNGSEGSEFDERPAAWGAVFALSLGAFALVASEFMPVSLLTPIASDLAIAEGQAGQAIAVSGRFCGPDLPHAFGHCRSTRPKAFVSGANRRDGRFGNDCSDRADL
ncbi:hypothetical protein [Rhizobium leguminosarum]|uniref:hypothetical protein n=1 Tax=Rhizobium leguminosarum TaxID=384 RepID=UPI003F4FC51B